MGRIFLYVSAVAPVLLLTLIYALVGAQGAGSPTASPSASASAASSAAPSTGTPAGTIMVSAHDLGFDPSTVDVPQAGVYSVTFHNNGAIAHDLTFADG